VLYFDTVFCVDVKLMKEHRSGVFDVNRVLRGKCSVRM
jgi:hypothetical protein